MSVRGAEKKPTTKPDDSATTSVRAEKKPTKPVPIRQTEKPKKVVAHSAPATSMYNPPKAPTSRPRIPPKDPPPMLLPPSPPVFQGVIAGSHIKDQPISRFLSQATYSSSVPSNVDFRPMFVAPEEVEFRKAQEVAVPRDSRRDSFGSSSPRGSLSMLGKSPTIFSLLKSEYGPGPERLSQSYQTTGSFGHVTSQKSTSALATSLNNKGGVVRRDNPIPADKSVKRPSSKENSIPVRKTSYTGFKNSSRAMPDDEDFLFPISLTDDSYLDDDQPCKQMNDLTLWN